MILDLQRHIGVQRNYRRSIVDRLRSPLDAPVLIRTIAGIESEHQPTITKLTSGQARSMVIELRDGPIAIDLRIPDAEKFLRDVTEGEQWVRLGSLR